MVKSHMDVEIVKITIKKEVPIIKYNKIQYSKVS